MKLFKNKFIISGILIVIATTVYTMTKQTHSISSTITNEHLENNINALNQSLALIKETDNPYYIRTIVDENGNVPGYKRYPDEVTARGITQLKVYNNKIFMGIGDWNKNTGSVEIFYYDPEDDTIKSSGTITDEAVEDFTIIDNKLYTTGTDPIFLYGTGGYYVYDEKNNKWDAKIAENGWIHVFDIEEYQGALFLCGSITNDAGKSGKSPIQVSYDNGETFEAVSIKNGSIVFPEEGEEDFIDNMRFYGFTKFNNELYAYAYPLVANTDLKIQEQENKFHSKYYGLYKYNSETNTFEYVRKLGWSSQDEMYGLEDTIPFNAYEFKTTTVFNDYFIYVSGKHIYKFKKDNLNDYEKIKHGTPDSITDVVIVGDTLYALSYQAKPVIEIKFEKDEETGNLIEIQKEVKKGIYNFDTRIYRTTDLKKFELVYEFNIDTLPFSLEHHNNKLYIGTVDSTSAIDHDQYQKGEKEYSEVGSLYQIDLDKFNKNLKLDKENNVIEINKDGLTYSVNYELNNNSSIFRTSLSFGKNMTKKEWEQEFTKFKNMELLYALVDNPLSVDYTSSSSTFNAAIDKMNNSNQNYDTIDDFVKNIFENKISINDKRINITTSDITETDNEYSIDVTLIVDNIDTKISSGKYYINDDDSIVYVGSDNDITTITNNIEHSNMFDIEIDSDIKTISLKYKNTVLKTYKIVRVNTEIENLNKYIYVSNYSDEEILDPIDVINGTRVIYDNKLQIKYKDIVLDEYFLVRIIEKENIIKNRSIIYKGNKTMQYISDNINIVNANGTISGNKYIISKDNHTFDELDIISVDFVNYKEIDGNLIVPKNIPYEEFIYNINGSDGIIYKIYDGETEVTSGNTLVGYTLKIYYNNIEMEEYPIIDEFLKFDASLSINSDNHIIENIEIGTSIEKVLTKINTSGQVSILDRNDNTIEDNNILLGTGFKIKIDLYNDSLEYKVSIKGDINGDGKVDADDIILLSKHVVLGNYLTALEYQYASDIDDNKEINVNDAIKLARQIEG